jgi:hypothetical protein
MSSSQAGPSICRTFIEEEKTSDDWRAWDAAAHPHD